jgi:F0F1-type ATP synthase assembly protein I
MAHPDPPPAVVPARPPAPGTRRAVWDEVDQSSVMTVELLAGMLVWGGLGWLADAWLGTKPWFLAIGTLLGFALGLYLVHLRAERLSERGDGRGR